MNYNRKEVKLAAKAAMRAAQPRPWFVTLIYTLLVDLVSTVLMFVTFVPAFLSGVPILANLGSYAPMHTGFGGTGFQMLFLVVLVMLYSLVMSFGYYYYTMNVSRNKPSGIGNLFRGFASVGRVLAVSLLAILFYFLWAILGGIAFGLVVAIASVLPPVLASLVFFVAYLLLIAFLLNRILRYSMASFVLLDNPDCSALEAIGQSKIMLKGRLWSLFVLSISFIGWSILAALLFSIVFFIGMLILSGGTMDLRALMFASAASLGMGKILGFFVVTIISFLASCVISLWLTAYQSIATVGFYDIIRGGEPCCTAPEPLVAPMAPVSPTPQPIPEAAPEVVPEAVPETEAEPEAAPEAEADADDEV